jgi:hypothetical protein
LPLSGRRHDDVGDEPDDASHAAEFLSAPGRLSTLTNREARKNAFIAMELPDDQQKTETDVSRRSHYCTISVRFWLCVDEPDLAVTTMV